MPVQSTRVSLDTAKDWAKRLAKTSRTDDQNKPWPLARCQLAVAVMLGYDNWHMLNEALNTAPKSSGKKTKDNPFLGKPKSSSFLQNIPVHVPEWPNFWRHLLDVDGVGGNIHVEFRDQVAKIRVRSSGQITDMVSLDKDTALRGILSVVSKENISDFEILSRASKSPETFVGDYVRGHFDIPNKKGQRPQMTIVPIYPEGFDVMVTAKPLLNETISLEATLPADIASDLRKLCSFSSGVFLFSGTAGSGRSTLMDQVVRDRPSSTSRIFTVEECPEVSIQKDRSRKKIAELKIIPGKTGVAKKMEQSCPLVIGEIMDSHACQAAFLGAEKGTPVFSTCHGSQTSIPDLMKAYGAAQKDIEKHLRGWAYLKLLPVLCPHCSVPVKEMKGLRKRGKGCNECGGHGVLGRQMVIDLWSAQSGTYERVHSLMDQARDLVKKGRVGFEDAVDLLGPLAL